jgi:hypothetical protein
MNTLSADRAHWDKVYSGKAEEAHSWFQADPAISLELIGRYAPSLDAPIIDIGAGDSRLVDALLAAGHSDITLLDLSEKALDAVRNRIGGNSTAVRMIATDLRQWTPLRTYAVWHDRAVLHFLTDSEGQHAYVEALTTGTGTGSKVIISAFAPDGPERCSGLPVRRYSAADLAALLGEPFDLVECRKEEHLTPGGVTQHFVITVFRRL